MEVKLRWCKLNLNHTMQKPELGYVSLTLHAHLPYVVNHGTWPHGLEWLLEAASETYLPLLRIIGELEAEGLALHANINLSPVLLEQLAHPLFKDELPRYLKRKVEAANVDEATFLAKGENHLSAIAIYWQEWYCKALQDFEMWNGDIISGFRRFNDAGQIEVITCAATHGYFPLLGQDESIRAQIRTGIETHMKHLGRRPRGIWIPECGYRPHGLWHAPVPWNGAHEYERQGVEELLAEQGIEYFFVDSHMLSNSVANFPYERAVTGRPLHFEEENIQPNASYYQPYIAGDTGCSSRPVNFFARDPRTSVQVWSGDQGYPGDGAYLEFHKKHWPGGHRYWRVTSPRLDLGLKLPYDPQTASAHTRGHALHFAQIAAETIRKYPTSDGTVPILSAPFDAELFGHWWFEGPQFLKQMAREISKPESPLKLITAGKYLEANPPKSSMQLSEGSWGKNGTNEVWLNTTNEWTWKQIYPAEQFVHEMAVGGKYLGNENATRLAKLICRELLLLQSSDWQFLITMKDARDYAEKRFAEHVSEFNVLADLWRTYAATGEISEKSMNTILSIENIDSIFQDIDPADWC
jgi:1,4-alpha-glucan branching enzyme